MNALGRWLVAGWISLVLAGSCSTPEARDPDSETNWLEVCEVDANCTGDAHCLCGLCTIACEGNETCQAGPPGSTCTPLPDTCTGSAVRGFCTDPSTGPPSNPSDSGLPSNPTGSCVADGSGARLGARTPEEGDVWLPDCDNPLSREYWRVFLRPSGTAYVIPDPSAAPQYYSGACGDMQHPLFEIVGRYSFCDLTHPDAAQLIDNMTPGDALAVAHYSHENLTFTCNLPAFFLEDVVDACELSTEDDAPELGAICDDARARYASGVDAGATDWLPCDGQAGADLGYLLNQLYGTGATRITLPIAPELCDLPVDTAGCSSTESRYFYDPRAAECVLRPFGSCGATVMDFSNFEACTSACIRRVQHCSRCEPTAGCDDTIDCSVCPVSLPEHGGACSDVGLLCDYGPGCGGTECACEANGDGGLAAWSCATRAC